jgi:hypothetical protein
MTARKIIRLGCLTLVFFFASWLAKAEDFTKAIRVSAELVFPGVDWERETNGLSPETVRGVDAFVHTLDTTGLMVTGSYGQFITVLPALDMVVAHKTLPTGNVKAGRYLRLLDLLTGKEPVSASELTAWVKAHGPPK